jgi:hypothetical protein
MSKDLIYRVKSREEFDRLSGAMGQFLEGYVLEIDGEVCVGSGVEENRVNIYPDSERGQRIKSVHFVEEPAVGLLTHSDPEGITLRIGETYYNIRYEPRRD